MALNKEYFLAKWRDMPTNKRMMLVGIGGVSAVLVLGVMFGSPAPSKQQQQSANTKAVGSYNLPATKDMSVEQMSVTLEALRASLNEEKNAREKLEKMLEEKNNNSGSKDALTSDFVRELRDMRVELDTLKAQKQSASEPGLDDQLPPDNELPPGGSGEKSQNQAEPVQADDTPKIRIVGGMKKERKETKEEAAARESANTIFLPAGSNFEGVLMNGMEAPTSSVAKQNPVPALVRLDTDAILPGRHRYDIRECFAIISGFGVLSTERAQLQTVTLSCVKTDGSVVETKMEGYIVGEDGKVGLRGRLVTRQGQLLAKSFAAGFFSAIGQAMAPTAVPQLNVSPGATTQFQMPSLSSIGQSAAAQGLQNSAKNISQFYLDMAKEMFPVVEIDAMRRVTIILIKGLELKISGGVN